VRELDGQHRQRRHGHQRRQQRQQPERRRANQLLTILPNYKEHPENHGIV